MIVWWPATTSTLSQAPIMTVPAEKDGAVPLGSVVGVVGLVVGTVVGVQDVTGTVVGAVVGSVVATVLLVDGTVVAVLLVAVL